MRTLVPWVLLIILAISLSSCCGLNNFSVEDQHHQEQDIWGIKQSLNNKIDIVFVHGMGGYASGDPTTAIEYIVKELSLTEQSQTLVTIPSNNPDIPNSGTIKIIKTESKDRKKIVVFYIVKWSQITNSFTTPLYNNDEFYNDRMVKANRNIKEGLLNNRLADVLLYQDTIVGPAIRSTVEGVYNYIQDDSDLVFITYSLGSKIIFDLFFEKLQTLKDKKESKKYANRLQSVFMLANQVPLLGIGPGNTFWASVKMMTKLRTNPKHWMVAFSDINDILSYALDTDLPVLEDSFINVLVTNERCSYYTFSKFGKIVNPYPAHLGYGTNNEVLNIIVNGYSR
ncbi:hypothetical protein [Desulforhopalus sp. 52FAK]